jgi:general secretion pathway protein L
MAKYLGIDIGTTSVRAVSVRSSYRRIVIEAMAEADLATAPTLVDAIRAAAAALVSPGESIAVNLAGERTFVRRIGIPPAAQRQLEEVLPFELEAELPFEISEAVYDHVVLRRISDDDPVPVLGVVGRIEDVRERIGIVKEALLFEPERVGPGAICLAGLAAIVPEVAAAGPVMLLGLEADTCDVLILEKGDPVFARTLSRGTAGLPETAAALSREIKQTISAFRAGGGSKPEIAYVLGTGAATPGAEPFLEAEIGITVRRLPDASVETADPAYLGALCRFGKAAALALSLAPRSHVPNLRRGVLVYEGGYGFLREKMPLLAGLGAVILVSFLLATWAKLHALSLERQTLESALGAVSSEVLGESTTDPQRALDLLDKTATGADEDPLPHADGFDVMVQLSQAISENLTHDIEELDVQRGHAIVHGIVPTIPDAQQIAATLKGFRCFQDVKIVRTNQVVGEDRQKYTLELDVKCPSETKQKGAAAPAGSASAGTTAGGKP